MFEFDEDCFDGYSRNDSYRVALCVDPEARTVYASSSYGDNAVPADVWHERHAYISLPRRCVGASVVEVMSTPAAQDALAALCDAHEGDEWNGQAHIGRWDNDARIDAESFLEKLAWNEIATYWDASDWLAEAWAENRDEAVKLHKSGLDASEIGVLWAEHALADGAHVNPADIARCVEEMLEQAGGES